MVSYYTCKHGLKLTGKELSSEILTADAFLLSSRVAFYPFWLQVLKLTSKQWSWILLSISFPLVLNLYWPDGLLFAGYGVLVIFTGCIIQQVFLLSGWCTWGSSISIFLVWICFVSPAVFLSTIADSSIVSGFCIFLVGAIFIVL